MNNKLFVGNLSFNVTENELEDTFAQYGTVLEANLMMDRMSGRPRGFGFVTMSTQEEAEKAKAKMKGMNGDEWATVNSTAAKIAANRSPASVGAIQEVKSKDLDGAQMKQIQDDIKKIMPEFKE